MAPKNGHIRKTRNRRRVHHTKDWNFEDLVRYFGGNRADAASQVCDKTIRYCLSTPNRSRYPLTPLCSPRSSPSKASSSSPSSSLVRTRIDPPTPYRASSRLRSETDPHILDFSLLTAKLTAMSVVRCNKCHRFMEGAPDPSVEHAGSLGDARCLLDHHPDPCDYADKKGKKCEEYGEFDPDYQPPTSNGMLGAGAIFKENHGAPPPNPPDTNKDIARLTARNDKMEANLGQVQDNVGQLSSEMAKLIKMVELLGKNSPNPAASLLDNGGLGGASSPQPPVTSGQSFHPGGQSAPLTTAAGVTSLADRATNLISTNSLNNIAKPSVGGYVGPSIPDLRKDKDLASLVRSEVQQMIATQLPSLQKHVENAIYENVTDIQQQTSQASAQLQQQQPYQASAQQQQQSYQASSQQQLAEFQAQQKQQMDQFLANQQQQLQALQNQLGGSVARQPRDPVPIRPGVTAHDYEPLHPAYTALQGAGSNSNLAMDMETLMGMTVRSKQFRPWEFAARTQLFYAKNITERNCNFPCFVLGYLRHCLILMSGLVPTSENEVSSRLTNLMNICEIAANNSTLNDFDCAGWQIAKAYRDRVFHDVETGQKTWEDLPASVMADTFLHAKDTVAMKTKKAASIGDLDPKTGKKKKKKSDESKSRVCTTYNSFRTGDGCAYEFNNSESKCVFEHFCKKCFAKSGKKETHKALNCDACPAEKTE